MKYRSDFNEEEEQELDEQETIKRYHVKSDYTYDNLTDLKQNYVKYLYRTGLIDAYCDMTDEEFKASIKRVLNFNESRCNEWIVDRYCNKYAREQGIKLVGSN